jgi:epoxyqueuosine reductase
LLERELAQRAGLGWIGKNTCLIHPKQGSYFLLAEILLGLDLEPDPPFTADRCGTCTRCIEACPTNCILPDRMLDARRCISYLTIEHKGAIPIGLRPKMGGWIFGCDVCQQVCPWNHRAATQPGDPAFALRRGLLFSDLQAELGLSAQAFNHKFRDHPVQRAKRRGYLRNIAVALANTAQPGNKATLEALAQALNGDNEPLVRAHAAWALGRLGGPAARKVLQNARSVEQDASVLAEIIQALADITGVMRL